MSLAYYAVPGLAVGAVLLYSALLFAAGKRREALAAVRWALLTLATAAAAVLAMGVANRALLDAAGLGEAAVVTVGGKNYTLYFTYDRAWESLDGAAAVFGEITSSLVSWILCVQVIRAALATPANIIAKLTGGAVKLAASAPVALTNAMGETTGWSLMLISAAFYVYATLEWSARVLTLAHPWLLALGSALAFAPKLSRLGLAMLAAYFVTGLALTSLACWSWRNVAEAEVGQPLASKLSDAPPPDRVWEWLARVVNPANLAAAINPATLYYATRLVANMVEGVANAAFYGAAFSAAMVGLAGLLTYGAAAALRSLAVRLLRV